MMLRVLPATLLWLVVIAPQQCNAYLQRRLHTSPPLLWRPQQKKARHSVLKSTQTRTHGTVSPIFMVNFGNIGGKAASTSSNELPRDVKDAVSKLKSSVQSALSERISRMDVEMPVGTKYGVENRSGKSKRRGSKYALDDGDDGGGDGNTPTRDDLETSDRELSRLFVEMFQPVGGDCISVVYNDDRLADLARRRWKGDLSAECRITSVDRKKKNKKGGNKKKKGMGFAAKMSVEMDEGSSSSSSSGPFKLPDNCEVAIFVAPGPKELVAVERICSEVGMGTLVILLNARLGNTKISSFGTDAARELFLEEFEPVFHLAAAPQEEAPGCLLYRSFPNDWILARKPKVGKPKTVFVQETKPTGEECREGFESIEIGDVEKGVEGLLENVATWFK